jgi:hypothetical protein
MEYLKKKAREGMGRQPSAVPSRAWIKGHDFIL